MSEHTPPSKLTLESFRWPWRPQPKSLERDTEPDFSDGVLMLSVRDFFDHTWLELAAASTQAVGSPGDAMRGDARHVMTAEMVDLDVMAEMADTDMLQLSAHGPRISYSTTTAEWMARVAQDPADVQLVTEHLNRLLGSDLHPLGCVLSSFVTLLLKPLSEASALESGGEEGAQPPLSNAEARSLARSASACVHTGCSRLHALVLDVLPPLQERRLALRIGAADRRCGCCERLIGAAAAASC